MTRLPKYSPVKSKTIDNKRNGKINSMIIHPYIHSFEQQYDTYKRFVILIVVAKQGILKDEACPRGRGGIPPLATFVMRP